MRITENQIRRIIRQTLKEALLKEQRASNWDEYVEITSGKGIANAEQFKILYQDIFKAPGWEQTNPWLANYAAVDGQTDSYDDYVDWYMRFNDTDMGKSTRGSARYLSPDHVISILKLLQKTVEEEAEKDEPSPPEEVSKRVRNRLARQEFRADKKAVKATAKADVATAKANYQEWKSLLAQARSAGELSEEEYKAELAWFKNYMKDEKFAAKEMKREDLKKLRQQRRQDRKDRRKGDG